MRFVHPSRPLPLWGHGVLLLGFVAVTVLVWMMPSVFLGGTPISAPTALLSARNFSATGLWVREDTLGRLLSTQAILAGGAVPSTLDGRLSTLLFSALSPWISWGAWGTWLFIPALLMGLALVPWWVAVRKEFDTRIAWVSTVILAWLPLTWHEAAHVSSYPLSYFFLYCCFASFVLLRRRWPLGAVAAAGTFFGLSVSAKDAFLVFLPFFLLAHAWVYRRSFTKVILGSALFLFCCGLMYTLPYVGDIQRYGYPVNQNLARIWPLGGEGRKQLKDGNYLHLYPDPYTYRFDRERFDADYLARLQEQSFLQQMQEAKLLVNFDVGAPGFLLWIGSGLWIFMHNIPSLFQAETVGGAFLWLFLLAGIRTLFRERRRLALCIGGLMFSSFLIINVVLHYEREHLMDFSWVFALLAALGIYSLGSTLSSAWGRRQTVLLWLMVALVSAQLIQENRLQMARAYAKSSVPWILSSAERLVDVVPLEGVIAVPYHVNTDESLALLTDRTMALFQESTVQRLLQEKALRKAWTSYGVTHAMGFSEVTSEEIRRQMPSIVIVPEVSMNDVRLPVSPMVQYLLHIVR